MCAPADCNVVATALRTCPTRTKPVRTKRTNMLLPPPLVRSHTPTEPLTRCGTANRSAEGRATSVLAGDSADGPVPAPPPLPTAPLPGTAAE